MTYTILLVDDEQPTLEAFYDGVDWDALSVGQVHTATGAEQARELFAQYDIQIMVCDIEMPGESGLELLEWVGKNHPDTISILLTCHADFAYAQRGLQSGALDYLLKPALYDEVEAVFRKAMGLLEKRREERQLQDQGKTFERNSQRRLRSFWRDVVRGEVGPTRERILAEAAYRGIKIDEGAFILVLCSIRVWSDELNGWNPDTLENTYLKVMESVFAIAGQPPLVLSLNRGDKLVFLPAGQPLIADALQIKERCSRFVNQFTSVFGCSICLYCSHPYRPEELAEGFACLERLQRANVAYDNIIFFEGERLAGSDELELDREGWRQLLLEGRGKELYAALEKLVQGRVATHRMDADGLLIIYHNFQQMVYATLAERQITADELIQGLLVSHHPGQALASVENMLAYAKEVIAASIGQLQRATDRDSLIGQVKVYIEENLGGELSRDEIARFAYLNPEYLSRLFKKETGLSLKDYIIKKRLTKAQDLLLGSSLTVTAIAYQVGYTNMPYFSRLFRAEIGMTPQEYRRLRRLDCASI